MFINYSPRYIVLNDGTLFFSHLTKDDMSYMNNNKVRCGMETIVENDNRFKWSHIVKMQNRTEGK